MSETSLVSYSDRELELSLKDLLERILIQMEKFIETKNDLNEVEQELKDYENLNQLVGIIKIIFTNLMLKIEKKLQKLEQSIDPNMSQKSIRTEDEYEKLEQTVIKYEGEIRNHIRLEQQLKLYAESIQTKLDESEETRNELLETTKNVMNNLKKENQKYYEENQKLQSDIMQCKIKIQQFELEQQKKTIECDLVDYEIQQITKNSQQIKGLVQRKPNCVSKEITNKTNSYSEHKLSSQLQESTDYPTQSQGSLKQNYFNILQFGQSQQQQIQSLQQSIQQQQEYQKNQHIKHNSISSINDIIQQHIIKDKKANIINYTQSKPNSQHSTIQQQQQQQKLSKGNEKNKLETLPNRSRSGSGRRNLSNHQKQKTSTYQ